MFKTLIGSAVAAFLVAGCGTGGTTTTAADGSNAGAPAVLRITTDEYSFKLDNSSVPAGTVEIALTNKGAEVHQALFYRLNEGVSFEEFEKAVIADDTSIPQLSRSVSGGVRSVAPKSSEERIVRFDEPGNYAVICFMPDQTTLTDKEHIEFGMIAPLTVE